MAARVERFIAEAERVGAEPAVEARIAQGLPIPGFGHQLYPAGDPRAAALLAAFSAPPAYEAIRQATEALTGVQANVDLALTAASATLGLPDGSPFLMFAIARMAGWQARLRSEAGADGADHPPGERGMWGLNLTLRAWARLAEAC